MIDIDIVPVVYLSLVVNTENELHITIAGNCGQGGFKTLKTPEIGRNEM